MFHWGRYRKFVAAIVTLVALVTLMSLTARERETMLVFERIIVGAIAPVQSWLDGLAAGIRGGVTDLRAVSRLRDENVSLKAKADAYDATVHRLRELEIENERLRRLLGFAQRVDYDYVVADVVGRNADNWFSRLTVNRGFADGVVKDMPVVTSQGLVGRVVAVSGHLAVVQLLTDRESGAGALIQSSRSAGIVSGRGSQSPLLSLMLFERGAVVNVDDAVVTSGFGEIYPPGLYVGRVVEVTKDRYGLLKYASVKPGVDFGRLEEVLVVTTPRVALTGGETAPEGAGDGGASEGGGSGGQ